MPSDDVKASLAWQPRLRILCLHGRCQTAATFEQKLQTLRAKAASFAEFVFVDGPVELPLQHEDRVNTRGWWAEGETSEEYVREVLAREWAEHGPFDGVLGFSEGASAAVVFCRLAADAGDSPGSGLRFAILAGAPFPAFLKSGRPGDAKLRLPSLHFASSADSVVPLGDSLRLAEHSFEGAQFCKHDGGHCCPQRVEDVRRIADFLHKQREAIYPWDAKGAPSCCDVTAAADEEHPLVCDEQREELEALELVYPDELVRISPAWPVRLAMQLPHEAVLRFSFPPAYPQEAACRCELESELVAIRHHAKSILAAAEEERQPLGFPSVLAMFQAAQQWIEDNADKLAVAAAGGLPIGIEEGDDALAEDSGADAWWAREETEVDEALLKKAEGDAARLVPDNADGGAAWARACGAGGYSRPWEFVVGLVGKPSAGKSTLFNALTRPQSAEQEASMAPHPFTTIDPNVGAGWFAAPCPAAALGIASSAGWRPEHGEAPGERRQLPVLVKDVAGLVPGAYLGRGRGNAFLNDLCDADSLIHVVDASGRSDSEGVDQGSSAADGSPNGATDPLDEVGWVRREIHMWIFCNVRAKWDSVRRKGRMATTHVAQQALADRLFSLFTGYHASRQLVMQVYEAAGFSLACMAEAILVWGEYELHLLVACFLRARFPIVVALNKADTPEARARMEVVRSALGSACVPVSARSEWWLWEQQRKGHLTYLAGGGAESVDLATDAPANIVEHWETLRSEVLRRYGSTGAQEVVSVAVRRRQPLFVCPVVDFEGFEPLQRAEGAAAGGKGAAGSGRGGKGAAAASQARLPLATMVMLRPLSTVEEAFNALKHEQMLRGDFVRAEVMADLGRRTTRVLKRDDTLGVGASSSGAMVLKVLTNKKSK